MDVKTSFAAQTYAQARPATAPTAAPAGSGEKSAFSQAVGDFAQTLKAGEETAKAAMVGDADPHALVQALASSQLAVESHTNSIVTMLFIAFPNIRGISSRLSADAVSQLTEVPESFEGPRAPRVEQILVIGGCPRE